MDARIRRAAALVLLAALPAARSQDAASPAPAIIEEVFVIGTPTDRYGNGRTDALTGIPLDFLELPRVVDVIPEQLLLDQKVTNLNDALRNSPGIAASDGFGGTNNDFFMRGFRRNTVYRDGLRRRSNFNINTANLDRIEVIKGPASISFGQVEPGGLVNVVTKRPLPEARRYVELRRGSWDDNFALVDLSQPLSDRLAVRVNASLQEASNFRDFTDIERRIVATSAHYDIRPSTRVGATVEYRDESQPLDRGTVAVPTADGSRVIVNELGVPLSRRFGEAFEIFETQFTFFDLRLEHDFNSDWHLRAALAHETSSSNDVQVRPRSILIYDGSVRIDDGFFAADPVAPKPFYDGPTDQIFLARRVDGSADREIEANYVNVALNGRLELAGIEHRISVLANYRDDRETRLFRLSPTSDGVSLPLFDVRNPRYGLVDASFSSSFDTDVDTDEYGIAVQDYLQLSKRLGLLLGLRYDDADADGSGPLDSVGETSPQIALRYAAADNVSLFASYSESFVPNTALTVDLDGNISRTEPFAPEEAEQLEAGVKAQFFDGRLNVTAVYYDISKTNVVIGSGIEAELADGQDSRGVELSVAGNPLPGMNLVLGYAYTDAELPDGTRPRNVAEHTANAWVSYEWQGGPLRGFGFGAGAFHQSDRFGDNANSWRLGSYTVVDASAWYNLPFSLAGRDASLPTRIQLSGRNLADERFYSASGFDGGQRINIGTPRAWILSLTTRF